MFKPRQPDKPEPGFYRLKLVKGGPWMPARITFGVTPDPNFPGNPMDRSPVWSAEIAGKPVHWDRIWPCAEEIKEAKFRYLMALVDNANRYRPDLPEASPREAVDVGKLEPIF